MAARIHLTDGSRPMEADLDMGGGNNVDFKEGTGSPGDGAIIALGTTIDTTDGNIRWTGSDFEGRKGGAWVSLTGAGGGGGDDLGNHTATQNLDMADFSIINVLEIREGADGTENNIQLDNGGGDLRINSVGTGNSVQVSTQSNVYDFRTDGLDLINKNLQRVDRLSNTSTFTASDNHIDLASGAGSVLYNVETGEEHDFAVNGNVEYEMGASAMDFNDNDLHQVGDILAGTSSASSNFIRVDGAGGNILIATNGSSDDVLLMHSGGNTNLRSYGTGGVRFETRTNDGTRTAIGDLWRSDGGGTSDTTPDDLYYEDAGGTVNVA